jgi:hypothetical protein
VKANERDVKRFEAIKVRQLQHGDNNNEECSRK